MKSEEIREKALKIFKSRGGILTTTEALEVGIHPRILYELRDSGKIIPLQKGLYALADLQDFTDPDLIAVSKKLSQGVICLITALYFHRLTVQIPRWIDIAIQQGYKPPSIQQPPVRFHWFSNAAYISGIEEHDFDGAIVKIYSKEKSIVDCFRLRKKVGLDVAIEALKNYWKQGDVNMDLLRDLAKICRVLRIIDPYIQMVMHDQS